MADSEPRVISNEVFSEVLARVTKGLEFNREIGSYNGLDAEAELVHTVAYELALMMQMKGGHDIESETGRQWCTALRIAFMLGIVHGRPR